ncbi:MAG: methylated-DNA--[protein]-cysteine S-methyltransferase [Candidatus Planktophila sp.]
MNELVSTTMSSPIGKLYILSRGTTVLGLNLSGFQDLLASLSQKELEEKIGKSSKIPGITDTLENYFDGALTAINSIAVKQPGGDFSQAAWASMRKIKAGTAESYADLAYRAGSPAAVRAAGSACAKNKIAVIIPCHRIIKSGGAIGAYGWGVNKKVWLLKHEGYEL